jgi:hypothetical protein
MNDRNMTEAEWLACEDPNRMLEFLQGNASARKFRLFACACVHKTCVFDAACRAAIGIAERFADGLAVGGEVQAICQALGDVTWAANRAHDVAQTAHQRQEEVQQWLRGSIGEVTIGLFRTTLAAAALARELTYHSAGIEVRLWMDVDEFMTAQMFENHPSNLWDRDSYESDPCEGDLEWLLVRRRQADFLSDIIGNPFRPLPPRPEAIAPLAEQIYAGAWDQMPILGEWLQEHGYWSEGEHCLDPSIRHVKGCWVVDWATGKE